MSRLLTDSFFKRLFSALVLAPLVLWILFQGGLLFYVLIGLVTSLALAEWANICLEMPPSSKLIYSFFGTLYILVCVYCFVLLPAYFNILLVFGIWFSDIGAYIIGRKFGKTRICPNISPNKTVSGLLGASFVPALILYSISLIYIEILGKSYDSSICYFNVHSFDTNLIYDPFTMLSAGTLALLFFVIGLAGQAGDLIISAMKRKVSFKDTGTLIPGHGGILDRIDALLLASPAFLGLLILIKVFSC